MFVILTVSECTTIDDKPCKLPFKYQHQWFDECTWFSAVDAQPWCSTNVDRNGKHLTGNSNWNYCGPGCPGVDGKKEMFSLLVSI